MLLDKLTTHPSHGIRPQSEIAAQQTRLMRVGLDISQAVKRKGRGIARYIREILRVLLAEAGQGEFEPVLYARGDRIFRRAVLSSLRNGTPVRWMPLRFYLVASRLQLFHSFGNYLPIHSRVPVTFTAHDFRVLDLENGKSGKRLLENVKRSSGIVCLTRHGLSRLLHYFPDYDVERTAIVPHGVDHATFRPLDAGVARATASKHGLMKPYLLQLGSWFPHKNLETSIEAFALSEACREGFNLAFVGGGANSDYRSKLDEIARSRGVGDQIRWVEDVPSQDIPAVLSAAHCLLQPSRYEGFALPLLEAMAVGTPGVASNSTCHPEVTAGVWPIFEQDQPEPFATFIDAMVFDSGKRQAAIEAGLERAAGFTWEQSASKTLGFFEKIIGLESR